LTDFEDIRPFNDSEVASALSNLIDDREFVRFVGSWLAPRFFGIFPKILSFLIRIYLKRLARSVNDIAGFQKLIANFASKLIQEGTDGILYEGFDQLDPESNYLFVSNHRDIAGDSMFLDYGLHINGFDTVRIAIGDNLIQRDFATSLMKLNKGFFIKRSVQGHRKAYAALLQASRYIVQSIRSGNSVWIAQSEGRSKDAIDHTDPALIKMLALSERRTDFSDFIRELNIVPTSISYEFDPCDVLKAKELETLSKGELYDKPEGEDLLALAKGLYGRKGRVVFRFGTVLDGSFESPNQVAKELDRQIVSNLELYPFNYWALSRLCEEPYRSLREKYTIEFDTEELLRFSRRLRACPWKYRKQFLQMYANPILNRDNLLKSESL
tara:strand:+ start:139 stop:1287 length:1149 start_codon:yes stop_codon:yes gene_type:complete